MEGNLEEEEEEQEEEKAIRAERKEKGHNLLLFSFLVFFGEWQSGGIGEQRKFAPLPFLRDDYTVSHPRE